MNGLSERQAVDLCGKAVALAAEEELRIAVAVVDAGGHLIGFRRMDGVAAAAAEIVTGKARTAALFDLPTATLDQVCRANPGFVTTGAVALEGGLPVHDGEQLVGAIAVSGAAPDRDAALARAALDTLGP